MRNTARLLLCTCQVKSAMQKQQLSLSRLENLPQFLLLILKKRLLILKLLRFLVFWMTGKLGLQ